MMKDDDNPQSHFMIQSSQQVWSAARPTRWLDWIMHSLKVPPPGYATDYQANCRLLTKTVMKTTKIASWNVWRKNLRSPVLRFVFPSLGGNSCAWKRRNCPFVSWRITDNVTRYWKTQRSSILDVQTNANSPVNTWLMQLGHSTEVTSIKRLDWFTREPVNLMFQ